MALGGPDCEFVCRAFYLFFTPCPSVSSTPTPRTTATSFTCAGLTDALHVHVPTAKIIVNICMCVLDDWFWKANEIPPKKCSCLDFRRALLTQALRNTEKTDFMEVPHRLGGRPFSFWSTRTEPALILFLFFFLIKTFQFVDQERLFYWTLYSAVTHKLPC